MPPLLYPFPSCDGAPLFLRFLFHVVVPKVSVHGPLYMLPFLGEIKARPYADGAQDGVLGMKAAEDLEIVGCLLAVDQCFM